MDLTELTNKFTELLKIEQLDEAPSKIMSVLLSCKNEIFDKWFEAFPDLTKDNLQPIFQYYMADRKIKMQDYTPNTLAKACVMLAGIDKAKSCYDMCAGSGALTIQAWNINKNCNFICEEFDERVIPFLLFNLSIRNTNAIVINGDVLSGERFKCYKLTASERYSNIIEMQSPNEIKADICVSNPPYNMKWKHEPFMLLDERFNNYGVPPESNANYAFILTALATSKRSALILPNCVLDSNLKEEKNIRQNIIDNNKIDSIIANPDNMFEATTIGTCLLCMDNGKNTIHSEFVDMRKNYVEEERKQRGQFGGKSHTNRTYIKTVKIYGEENLNEILSAVNDKECKTGLCKSVSIEDIKTMDYSLNPLRFIEMVCVEPKHRDYADIIADINRTIEEKNCCKLVINETLAKRLGLEKELYTQNSAPDDDFDNFIYKLTGSKILQSDYIQFTKNKNEFSFKNNNADFISTILTSIFQMWKQHVMYLNEVENRYLVEMRDAILPELMSGKIEVQ